MNDGNDRLLYEDNNIREVSIKEGIKEINNPIDEPFISYCDNLEKVTIPSSLESINGSFIAHCKNLKEITIPGNVKKISIDAFSSNENLSKVILEEGIEEVCIDSFVYCPSLKSIYIPSTVKRIHIPSNESFKKVSLEKIEVSKDNKVYHSYDGLLYRTDRNIINFIPPYATGKIRLEEGIKKTEGFTWFFFRSTTINSIDLPSTYKDDRADLFYSIETLKEINVSKDNPHFSSIDGVLYDKKGEKVIALPNQIEELTIKNDIFNLTAHYNTNLKKIIVGEDVTDLHLCNSKNLIELREIDVSPLNKDYSSIDGILYDKNVTTLLVIPHNYNKEVVIPSTVEHINFNLEDLNIPSIRVEEGNKNFFVFDNFLYDKASNTFDVLESKEYKTFYVPSFYTNTNLVHKDNNNLNPAIDSAEIYKRDNDYEQKEVDSYFDVKGGKIYGDENILKEERKVVPVDSKKGRWNYAFLSVLNEYREIESINVSEDNPCYSSVDGVLYNKNKTILLYCPLGKKGEVIIPSETTMISSLAFCNCRKITKIVVPSSVNYIGYGAFINCRELKEVSLQASVAFLPDDLFYGCSSLENLGIPEGVRFMGDSVITGGKDIYLPSSLTLFDFNTYPLLGSPVNVHINPSSNIKAVRYVENSFSNINIIGELPPILKEVMDINNKSK